MKPKWDDVELSFDAAAERIIAAHGADGEAADLPITDIRTWAVAPKDGRFALVPLARHHEGPEPDIIFNDDNSARLLLRRSHTDKQEVMERTKTRVVIVLDLPAEVGLVLKAHVEELEKYAITRSSDLLFPSTRTGGLQTKTALSKAFEGVRLSLGLPKLTPKAMRRTWKDVARSAGIEAVVRKAVTGHATDAMEVRYSTAQPGEKKAAMEKVVSINTARSRKATG